MPNTQETRAPRAAIGDIIATLKSDREHERDNLAILVSESEGTIASLREHHLAAVQAMQDHFNHTIEAMTGIFDRLVVVEENRLAVLRTQMAAIDAADNGGS